MLKLFNQLWNKYMKNTVEELDVSELSLDEVRRYQIIFSGVVQGVGFRYETWRIAEKLGLTGFAENLLNGNVRAEIQGPKDRIMYLIDYLKSVPRIHIDKIEIDEIRLKEEENFQAIY